jgi:hypothetical protein
MRREVFATSWCLDEEKSALNGSKSKTARGTKKRVEGRWLWVPNMFKTLNPKY